MCSHPPQGAEDLSAQFSGHLTCYPFLITSSPGKRLVLLLTLVEPSVLALQCSVNI